MLILLGVAVAFLVLWLVLRSLTRGIQGTTRGVQSLTEKLKDPEFQQRADEQVRKAAKGLDGWTAKLEALGKRKL